MSKPFIYVCKRSEMIKLIASRSATGWRAIKYTFLSNCIRIRDEDV